MTINYSTIKERIIIKFITIFILLTIVGGISSIFVIKDIDNRVKQLNESRIKYIYDNFSTNHFLEIICAISGCYDLYVHDYNKGGFVEFERDPMNYFLKKNPALVTYRELANEFGKNTSSWVALGTNYDIIVRYPLHSITKDHINKTNILTVLGIIFIMSLILSIVIVYVDVRYNGYKEIRNKHSIYDKLRLELTESLHHELAGPMSVMESNFKYFIKTMDVKCDYTPNHKCIYYGNGRQLKECENCKAINKELYDRLNSTLIVLESMKSVLCIISQFKKMKYQKENILISVLLDTISALNRINTYNITSITILDKDLTEGYYAYGALSDGLLFNIIMTLINNSNEAGATIITITPEVHGGIMNLYIADNGSGLIDKEGNFITNPEKLFQYGFSTKVPDKNDGINIIKRIIRALTTTDVSSITSRGAGLPIARKFLRENGGDIVLSSTNQQGTVFKITFPVLNKTIKDT